METVSVMYSAVLKIEEVLYGNGREDTYKS